MLVRSCRAARRWRLSPATVAVVQGVLDQPLPSSCTSQRGQEAAAGGSREHSLSALSLCPRQPDNKIM